MRWVFVVCLLPILCMVLSTTGATPTPPIQVFVSVAPLKYFVERIGGDQVEVSVMVPPGRSPHAYDPTPRQMTELSKTRLYYRIGMPFEDVWMDRIAALNPDMRVIDLREGIELLTLTGHGHEGEADREEKDPHLWTDPHLVKIMAEQIRRTLTESNPGSRDVYAENHRSFLLDLDQLDLFIRHSLKDVKQRAFLVFHPAWGYFAEAYDLKQIAIEAQGKEPGPRALAEMINMAKSLNIRVIFVQQQFSTKTAETVARAIGGEIMTVDPLAEDYLVNMRTTVRNFARALRE